MDAPGLSSRKPSSDFFAMPHTTLGRWSAWLLLVSFLAILVNTAFVMPWTEQTSGLDDLQQAINLAVFVVTTAAGVVGLIAVVSKRERSVFAFLSIALLLFALAMNLGPMLFE